MNKNFFDLPIQTQTQIVKGSEDRLGLPAHIIEKDIWICWLLEALFKLPQQMTFKGGTSLSKCFDIIQRFSEDVDITIDYRNFAGEIDHAKMNRTQQKKLTKELKSKLNKHVEFIIVPHLNSEIKEKLKQNLIEIKPGKTEGSLEFYYPKCLPLENEYIREHVLLEFGATNHTEPSEPIVINTMLANALDEPLVLPTPSINTLSPLRTFWEKSTLIHIACQRGNLTESPDRLSRHWYDLHKLENFYSLEKILDKRAILENIIEIQKSFYFRSYINYEEILSGKLCLIPKENELENLRRDFNKMQEAQMFHKEPPKFDAIMSSLKILEIEINSAFK